MRRLTLFNRYPELREKALDLVVRHLPVVVWTSDTELQIANIYGQLALDLGLTPKSLFETFETDDPNFPPIAETLAALAGESGQFEFSWKDIHLVCAVEPLRSEKGDIIGAVVAGFDVTEQRLLSEKLQESQQSYRDVFEHSTDAIFTMDLQGRLLTANRAMETQTGFARAELLKRTLHQLVPSEQSEKVSILIQEQLGGATTLHADLALLRTEGEPAPVTLHARLLFDSGMPATIQVIVRRSATSD